MTAQNPLLRAPNLRALRNRNWPATVDLQVPATRAPGGPGHGGPGHGGPGHHCGGAGGGGAPGAGGASGNGGGQPATGGAQSGNGGASAGGVSGNGGEPLGSFTLSTPRLDFFGCPSAQTVVITNTSSVPLTWHASSTVLQGDSMNPNFPFRIAVSPLGSTLAPGAAVDLSIVPGLGVTSFFATVNIDADVAPSQAVNLMGQLTPTVIPPPDIDLGNVPLGSASQIFIAAQVWSFTYPTEVMSSSNPDFALNGMTPFLIGLGC